jgi:hypothetical protein
MATKRVIRFTRDGKDWNANGSKAKDHKSDFPEATGPYDIHLEVGVPTGTFQFPDENPIFMKKMKNDKDDECPTSFEGGDIFSYTVQDTTLILHNKNDEEKPTSYRYQLNVWDKRAEEWVNIDPILTNGGRGGR